ncbi:MAG: RNA polymerase sigma factor [Thermodesulfobacteriota bacterium]
MNQLNAVDNNFIGDADRYLSSNQLSDEELVSMFVENGDEGAFDAIVRRYSEKVFHIALRITDNSCDAEEVSQEVFLALYNKAKTFRGDSKFSTWLHRLITNASFSLLRKRKKHNEVSLEDYLPKFQDDEHHFVRPVVDWSQKVENIVEEKEIYEIIQKAMNELSPLDKAVVVLSEIEEFTNPDIAEILNLSVAAVKARLHRSRLFLRGKLTVTLGYSPT